MGTSLNKVLKDFIVRYKNMTGWNAKYVPAGINTDADRKRIIKRNRLDRKKCRYRIPQRLLRIA
jgi:isoleucyl-tRNA synthetase